MITMLWNDYTPKLYMHSILYLHNKIWKKNNFLKVNGGFYD